MVSRQAVEAQLKRIHFNFRSWGRSEVAELHKILMENEEILQCVNGQYVNGFALLVATNYRVLLIDKKPFLYLTVEDLRFDLISDFNFNNRLLDATIRISAPNKVLVFTSWNQPRLRKVLECVQQRVIEMRQQHYLAQQFEAAAAAQFSRLQTPQPSYAPNLAADTSAPAGIPSGQSQERRSNLGTYTRSKLPSLRRRLSSVHNPRGEVYPDGYTPGILADLQRPLEYEY